MCSVVYKAGDVVLGHFWELLLEDTFQAGEDDGALPLSVIVDDAELDLASSLLDDGGLSRSAVWNSPRRTVPCTFSWKYGWTAGAGRTSASGEVDVLSRFTGLSLPSDSVAFRLPKPVSNSLMVVGLLATSAGVSEPGMM